MSDFVFADYEGISEPFPGLDDATKQVLETIKQKLTSFSLFADEQEIYFAVIGLVLNIFHFIVLVQKSMMTSSTNMILVGIAIADLVFLTAVVLSYLISQPWRYSDVCYTPASYISTYALHIMSSVRNAARRSSCWLAIFMALTRVVVMNNMHNPKYNYFSTIKFGRTTVISTFILSIFITLFYACQISVGVNFEWSPLPECGFPENFTITFYNFHVSKFFTSHDIIRRTYQFIDSLVSQMAPCTLLPIFTIWLIVILRKLQKSRFQCGRSIKKEKFDFEVEKDCQENGFRSSSSTKLVTILSISFFISIFPVGLSAWLQTFIKLHAGPTQIIVAVNRIFSVAFIINTTLNCVFCGIMSSPYRQAAKELSRCKKKKQFNRVSTVASIV